MSVLAQEPVRFTLDHVRRMVDAGVFDDLPPVELIDGWLVPRTPQGPEHVWTTERIRRPLARAAGDGWAVLVGAPLVIDDRSAPEPDLAVVPFASGELPKASTALLAVEIAKTPRLRDEAKAPLYARGGVPVYWIVDLEAREVVVHTGPGREGYAARVVVGEGGQVDVPFGSGGALRVADLLGG